jgi:hypothetical protein
MKLFSRRPQFSLLTLLMVMTIIALAIVAYRKHFAAQQLATKLEIARSNLIDTSMCRGNFTNYPKHLFVAMQASLSAQLPGNGQHYPLGFRPWHIHIPEGRQARAYVLWNNIADVKANFTRCKEEQSLLLKAGPHALSFYVFRDSAGDWNYRLASTTKQLEHHLTEKEAEWLGKPRMVRNTKADSDVNFWEDVRSGPYELGGGQTYGSQIAPLTLWMVRYPPPGSTNPKGDEPANGFAVMLKEEVVAPKVRIQRAQVEHR